MILLRGENGTGKTVLARWIRQHSKRSDRPFVTVHCPMLSRRATQDAAEIDDLQFLSPSSFAIRAALRGERSNETRAEFSRAFSVALDGRRAKFMLTVVPIPEFSKGQFGALALLYDVTDFARLDELRLCCSQDLVGRGHIPALCWLSRFPDAEANGYVFPRFSVGIEGNARRPKFYAADFTQPIGEWKKAWKIANKAAGMHYRGHDCRHTFMTRLAENPNVSEETIRSLAGHVSKKMLERYRRIRISAKQAAIATLDHAVSSLAPEEPQMSRAQSARRSENRIFLTS